MQAARSIGTRRKSDSGLVRLEHAGLTEDVALECQRDDISTVRFTITDTGIGIRRDHLPMLFLPFSPLAFQGFHRHGQIELPSKTT